MVPPCAAVSAQKETEMGKQIAVHDFCHWLNTKPMATLQKRTFSNVALEQYDKS